MNSVEIVSPQMLYTSRVRGHKARTVLLHTLVYWHKKIENHVSQNPQACTATVNDARFVCKTLLKSCALGDVHIAFDERGIIQGVCEVAESKRKTHIVQLLSSPEFFISRTFSAPSMRKTSGAGAVLLAHAAKMAPNKKLQLTSLRSAVDFYLHLGFKTQDHLSFTLTKKRIPSLIEKYSNKFELVRDLRTHTFGVNSHAELSATTIASLQDMAVTARELSSIEEIRIHTTKDLRRILKLPLTKVETLILEGPLLTVSDLKNLSNKFSATLKKLSLYDCQGITSFNDCAFPALEAFTASNSAIDDNALNQLAKISPLLSRLELEECDDLCLLSKEIFPSLTEVILMNCKNLSNDGLKNITLSTPSLQFFKLAKAPKITSVDGCSFEKWTDLEYFYFSGTSVSQEDLAKIELRAEIDISS